MCVSTDVAIGCVFRRCLWWPLGYHSLVFALPPIPNFRFPLRGVEVRSIATELLVWGIRGDFLFVFSFV
jgi:hypothetical protein